MSVETSGRRNSGKRGSLAEDDPEVEAKKLRSILDVMASPCSVLYCTTVLRLTLLFGNVLLYCVSIYSIVLY